MKVFFRKTLPLILFFSLLLTLPCLAAESAYDFEGKDLDTIIAEFMAEHGLTEENFAMGWYDTVTGESWYYNADKYIYAGSLYKLPLNMEYVRLLDEGLVSLDDRVGAYPLEYAMYMSMVHSDNNSAQALVKHLGLSSEDYHLMLAQFSGIPEEELPEDFFLRDKMSPRFVLNTLIHLYENREYYAGLIDYMSQSKPGRYFRYYQGDYTIAHKYGSLNGCINDCAIVYTPTPFLLVAFTDTIPLPEHVLGSLCDLFTAYSLYRDALPEPTPEPTPSPSPVPTPEPATEPSAAPIQEMEAPYRPTKLWLIPGILFLALLLFGLKKMAGRKG